MRRVSPELARASAELDNVQRLGGVEGEGFGEVAQGVVLLHAVLEKTFEDLRVRFPDERVTCDEVGDDALRPRRDALPVVERHHELPEQGVGAPPELLELHTRLGGLP